VVGRVFALVAVVVVLGRGRDEIIEGGAGGVCRRRVDRRHLECACVVVARPCPTLT
jgi:hypothetical protein